MTERVQCHHNPKFIAQDILLRKNENKGDGGVRNIAVTFLTLETNELNSPADEYDVHVDDDDIRQKSKFLHEFRVRRKYPFTRKTTPSLQRNDTFLELGLLGKGYLNEKGHHNTPAFQPKTKENAHLTASPNPSDIIGASRNSLGLPPVSPRSTKSDNPTLSNIHQFSYLNTDFGFGKYRTDTFSGLGVHSSRNLFHYGGDLQSRLATQARRHIDACTTVGMVRKRSRAAQNVLGLKKTIEEGAVFDKYGKLVPLPINVDKEEKNDTNTMKSSLRSSNDKTKRHRRQALPLIYGNSSFRAR